MKVLKPSIFTQAHPIIFQLSKMNYKLSFSLSLLIILIASSGAMQAQTSNESYLSIDKVKEKNRLNFEIGEVIKFKLNTSRKEQWQTKTITGVNVEENRIIFGDEEIAISAIDRVLVLNDSQFGKWLNRIIFASVGLIGTTNLVWRYSSNINLRTWRIRNKVLNGGVITAITASLVKLCTVRSVYKLGKNHELRIMNSPKAKNLSKSLY